MSDDVMRSLGRVEGKLSVLCDSVSTVADKVDSMQSNGCARGMRNSERLDKIETAPSRRGIVSGTAAGGAVVGIIEGIRLWFSSGSQ